MCNRPSRELFDPSPAGIVSAQSMNGAFDAVLQHERQGQVQEEWQQRLCSLQQRICELLIENEQLRMSVLDSATSHQSREANE